MQSRCIIIGAGIVGSAVAYELSRRGVRDIHVLDPDLEGSLSSTERNAGGVRHLWSQTVNIEMSRISLKLFHQIAEEIGFQRTGYLWLYNEAQAAGGEAQLATAKKHGLSYERLSVADIRNRYPFIDRTEDLKFALYGTQDGLINPNALKLYFREKAKKQGVQFQDRHWVTALMESGGKVTVKVSKPQTEVEAKGLLENPIPVNSTESWDADIVINCTGAWAGSLDIPGINRELTQPIRRQIALFKSETFDMSPYGMIIDTSRVYFHPEGGNILSGVVLKDEKPGFHFNYDSDFFESHIWPALYERSSHMERLKHVTGWGGLYSYTPDTTGILGLVPGMRSIYECHSFTGRGLMQSYGAAVALSELILDKKFLSFDATPLHRSRFERNELLPEGLHI